MKLENISSLPASVLSTDIRRKYCGADDAGRARRASSWTWAPSGGPKGTLLLMCIAGVTHRTRARSFDVTIGLMQNSDECQRMK